MAQAIVTALRVSRLSSVILSIPLVNVTLITTNQELTMNASPVIVIVWSVTDHPKPIALSATPIRTENMKLRLQPVSVKMSMLTQGCLFARAAMSLAISVQDL
jgi:hypothetical protein